MLYPMFGMIALSGLVVILLYGSRFILISQVVSSGNGLERAKHADETRPHLPGVFRNITDNYNHIFEQPTLFYAVVIYLHLVNQGDEANVMLAWGYVIARLAHSVIQITINHVPLRIMFFVVSGFCLLAMIVREVLRLL